VKPKRMLDEDPIPAEEADGIIRRLNRAGDEIAARETKQKWDRLLTALETLCKRFPDGKPKSKPRKARQADRVMQALRKLYPPDGVVPAEIPTATVCGKVADELAAESQHLGLPDPSWATIKRALGRTK